MSDTSDTLARLVAKHERAINGAAGMLSDLGALLLALLPKCDACDAAATVRHAVDGVRACDHCAARRVVESSKGFNREFTRVPLVVFRNTGVKADDAWIDLPNAQEVRSVVEYVSAGSQAVLAVPTRQLMH